MSEGLHSKRPLTSLTSPICITGRVQHEQTQINTRAFAISSYPHMGAAAGMLEAACKCEA